MLTSFATRSFFLILLLVLSCRTIQLSYNACALYRNGVFIENSYNKSGLGHWKKMTFLFKRKDSAETVYTYVDISLKVDTSFYKINWINPCSYKVTYISGTNNFVDSLIHNGKLSSTKVYTVIKSFEKYFIQKSEGQKDTVWVQL